MAIDDFNQDEKLSQHAVLWIAEAFSMLEARFSECILYIDWSRWVVLPDGSGRKLRTRPIWNPRKLDEVLFDSCKHWQKLQELAEQSEFIRRYLTGWVGDQHGSRRTYSVKELFRLIAPPLEFIDVTQVYANTDEDPSAVFNRFIEELKRDSIKKVTVWPIIGVTVESNIDLEEGVTFRKLTHSETAHCLNFGLLPVDNFDDLPQEQLSIFGLAFTTEVEKFGPVQTRVSIEKLQKQSDLEHGLLEDFLVSTNVATGAPVSHAGGFLHPPSIVTGDIFYAGVLGRGGGGAGMQFFFSDTFRKITQTDSRLIFQIWNTIRKRGKDPKQRQATVAARRLFYSSERQRSSDRLVDLMVAAEALYLESEDNGEIRYRLSVNAANWDTQDHIERKRVFDIFREAYALRSKIVHGLNHDDKMVVKVSEEIKPVIERATVKLFHYISEGIEIPAWNSLLFAAPLIPKADDEK